MKRNKNIRTVLAFAVTGILLLLIFFTAINTGSLSVTFGQLMRGLFMDTMPMWRRCMTCGFREL